VLYLNLFFVSNFKFLCNYFLKFIIHKINSEMAKSEKVVLTEREKKTIFKGGGSIMFSSVAIACTNAV
jgi:hypothetical protein